MIADRSRNFKIDVGRRGRETRERGGHKRILTCAPVTNRHCLAFSLPAGSRPHYLRLYMASQLIFSSRAC